MTTKVYNQNFWKEKYLNENNINEWFKNYITYYSKFPGLEQAKKDFISGEKELIKELFNDKKVQDEISLFLESIVNEF